MHSKTQILILLLLLNFILPCDFGDVDTSLEPSDTRQIDNNQEILQVERNRDTIQERIKNIPGFVSNQAIDSDSFVTVWNTKLEGVSEDNQIKLPLSEDGVYDFVVDWGDGSNDTITDWNQTQITHTYTNSGKYQLVIDGIIRGWSFKESEDKGKIIELSQWGSFQFGDGGYHFEAAGNMVLTATDAPDLSQTTTLAGIFKYCRSLGSSGSMSEWNISGIVSMYEMFTFADTFNMSLNAWDVSNVVDMAGMFAGTEINQPLNKWDVGNVEDMSAMFSSTPFNQDISSWDVSNVVDMAGMFHGSSFNQPLNLWDVSNVKHMQHMFQDTVFNQDISYWDVSSVEEMHSMFENAGLSNENYDRLLEGWSRLNLQLGVTFDAGTSMYSPDAEVYRDILIDKFNWQISDGGLDPSYPTPEDTNTSTSNDKSGTSDSNTKDDASNLRLDLLAGGILLFASFTLLMTYMIRKLPRLD